MPAYRQALKQHQTWIIQPREALLLAAILILVTLALVQDWPEDGIFRRAIDFLAHTGVFLPVASVEADRYWDQVMNVVQLYDSLNLLHYLMVSVLSLLFGIHWIQIRKGKPGFGKRVWILVGLLLLVFPALNLALSTHMFFTPAVFGTSIASSAVVFAGIIE